jgi:hypothetical protein
MNICKKCHVQFPNWIKIDGKLKNLHCRQFCLICSPYKTHNTKNLANENYKPTFLIKNGIKYKLCCKCGIYLQCNSENYYINKNKKVYSYCKQCGKNKTVTQQKQLKLQCINYKGGKCSICGYDKYFGSMEFHHLDPSKKDFGISDGRCYNFNKIKIELDKCILVCSNCHKEIHGGITNI